MDNIPPVVVWTGLAIIFVGIILFVAHLMGDGEKADKDEGTDT